ncbi:hypothetical protein OGM63_15000 [Plectonema radiosum NIES-515]|uniref:Uncharacterized protein n=1 Tax=Plectonema radiosum NIES-515 TaxID=2986073 RepID=A0ABT3B0A0_9CYAN|nr:hypothetical protein [Plectonema radiosum]MCV3214808.1 hypothetical protein [Plectonema radiosum NIES-515]
MANNEKNFNLKPPNNGKPTKTENGGIRSPRKTPPDTRGGGDKNNNDKK